MQVRAIYIGLIVVGLAILVAVAIGANMGKNRDGAELDETDSGGNVPLGVPASDDEWTKMKERAKNVREPNGNGQQDTVPEEKPVLEEKTVPAQE